MVEIIGKEKLLFEDKWQRKMGFHSFTSFIGLSLLVNHALIRQKI